MENLDGNPSPFLLSIACQWINNWAMCTRFTRISSIKGGRNDYLEFMRWLFAMHEVDARLSMP